jgi:hypothetical protein
LLLPSRLKYKSVIVTVDAAPLLERVRSAIGRAVTLKTRQRALEHEITFPQFALCPLDRALLEPAVARPLALRFARRGDAAR